MATNRKYWRDAATLIVTSPTTYGQTSPASGAYDILMVKRGRKSHFYANTFVFPGGVSSDADFDGKWQHIFHSISGIPFEKIEEELRVPGQRPPMMTKEPDAPNPGIPLELGFRISAIRETFEECGVLLVTHENAFLTERRGHLTDLPPNCSHIPQDFDHKAWRKRVESDPSEFQKLCMELRVVPNIWSLYEWSNWLTPTGEGEEGRRRKRFDTLFYVCCLEHHPDNVEADLGEVSSTQWLSAGNWLKLHQDHKVFIGPPQVYELARLSQLHLWQDLHTFLHKKAPLGIERWMPVVAQCEDGPFLTLPGDELYPKMPDYQENEVIQAKGPYKEVFSDQGSGHYYNRSTMDDHLHYLCNIELPHGAATLPGQMAKL